MTEISTHIINCNKYKLKLQIKKHSQIELKSKIQ